MDHVAIMKPSWGLIPKILSGEKTIESRWYQTRRAPWDRIQKGDRVYFKDAGQPVSVVAEVEAVKQYTMTTLADVQRVVAEYGARIALVNSHPETWGVLPRYCILMFLRAPQRIEPFGIDRSGFGAGVAWLSVPDIARIRRV